MYWIDFMETATSKGSTDVKRFTNKSAFVTGTDC